MLAAVILVSLAIHALSAYCAIQFVTHSRSFTQTQTTILSVLAIGLPFLGPFFVWRLVTLFVAPIPDSGETQRFDPPARSVK